MISRSGELEVASNEESLPRPFILCDVLLETTLHVLGKVLGEKPAGLILGHLEKNNSSLMYGEDVRFEAFSERLRKLLSVSSTIGEKLILKALFIGLD